MKNKHLLKKEQRAKVHTFYEDFKKFVSRGNVIDMAVGVAVASAFTAIVSVFTSSFITPLLLLLTDEKTFSGMKIILRAADEAANIPEIALLWGDFVQAILNFFIIAFFLFLALRFYNHISEHAAELTEDVKEKIETQFDWLEKDEEPVAEPVASTPEQEDVPPSVSELETKLAREEELLTEIRDLLREMKENGKT